jgi:hypothetical protein
MILTCSADMQKALKIKAEPISGGDSLFTWYAHTIKLKRKNCVVLMNSASRFNIILYGLRAADFSKFENNVTQYIREALESYCLSPEIIDAYLKDCGEVMPAKNTSRHDTSRLNKVTENLRFSYDLSKIIEESILQTALTKDMNRFVIYEEEKKIWNAESHLFALLKEKYQMPLYKVKMYRLKITLDFDRFEISRELLVPEYCTFRKLHFLIQKCFNWKNYHMYEFDVIQNKKIPILIGPDAEDNYLMPCVILSVNDRECTVADIFDGKKRVIYTYDMGDNWEHEIRLLDVIEEHDDPTPKCLKATGKAPPEDCGGSGGYAEFLEQIQNGDKEYLEWAESEHWGEKSVEEINRELRWLNG